jgi:geranylgeranyl pyrophosphate synthase
MPAKANPPANPAGKTYDIERILSEKKSMIDSIIEKYIPRKYSEQSLESTAGKARYAYDVDTATKAISELVWDFLDRGGKRWRPALFLLVAEAIGGEKAAENVKEFVLIPEIVHNGSLLVDDIEDDSPMRRGKPAVHKIYGVDLAVNAGNAMYYLPLLAFIKNKDKFDPTVIRTAYEIYAQEMIDIHFGQAFDIYWHKGKGNPTEQQYLQMCAYKTGTLARLSAKLGALLAGGTSEQIEACGKYAETIGVAFQIQDDILNLTGEEFAKGKGLGEDIHEGKRTLMVIHCLKHAPADKAARLREILAMHTNDEKLIDEAIAIIKSTGSIEYAKEFGRKMVSGAWSDVDRVLPESEAKHKLKAFADYLIERKI